MVESPSGFTNVQTVVSSVVPLNSSERIAALAGAVPSSIAAAAATTSCRTAVGDVRTFMRVGVLQAAWLSGRGDALPKGRGLASGRHHLGLHVELSQMAADLLDVERIHGDHRVRPLLAYRLRGSHLLPRPGREAPVLAFADIDHEVHFPPAANGIEEGHALGPRAPDRHTAAGRPQLGQTLGPARNGLGV